VPTRANCCVARYSQPRCIPHTISASALRAPLALSRAASAAVLTDTPLAGALYLARRLIPRFLNIVAVYTKKAIINIVLNMPTVVKSSIIDGILRLLF